MQSPIGHDLMKTDFENPEVLEAANPSGWGYHHGAHVLCTCQALQLTATTIFTPRVSPFRVLNHVGRILTHADL
jgi:hypothetical protein